VFDNTTFSKALCNGFHVVLELEGIHQLHSNEISRAYLNREAAAAGMAIAAKLSVEFLPGGWLVYSRMVWYHLKNLCACSNQSLSRKKIDEDSTEIPQTPLTKKKWKNDSPILQLQ
jgi:hypothetical protein